MATCRADTAAGHSRAHWRRPLRLLCLTAALFLLLSAGTAPVRAQIAEAADTTALTRVAEPARGAERPERTSLPILVAAASDLRFAMDDIVSTFREKSGYRVRITYGSTGNFAYQIREGAPFHLFLAADERYVESLANDGLTLDAGTLYAIGRLALVVPRGTLASTTPTLGDVRSRLAASPNQRFAIANPGHAPYGERARDVLQHRGLWDALQPQLVLGENVSQAAQFALSGNTVGGLIAWSLALAPQIAAHADSALLPETWHSPLKQRMVLLRGAPAGAFALYDYLRGGAARNILKRYGFSLPAL